MRILIDIGHPADVHFFKNVIWNLGKKGHEMKITARKKDVTLDLLNAYHFKYEYLGENRRGLMKKAYGMIKKDYILYRIVKRFKPDVLLGFHNPYIAQIGKLTKIPSIIFTDTESVGFSWLVFYFASVICTPSCFMKNIGEKHVRYDGYKELAYLHPNYFEPGNIDELKSSGRIIILRFISWDAYHDVNLKGFDIGSETDFIEVLERYGRVFISSERKLDKNLEKYRMTIPPEKIHSLLYYADLYIGEGGTMAAEAAILGTPSIHIESTSKGIATGELSGNFIELRDKYGLLYFYPDQNKALEKAIEILENENSKKEWQRKRERLLSEKIDVTAWMTDFIERFPDSFYEYKLKCEEDVKSEKSRGRTEN